MEADDRAMPPGDPEPAALSASPAAMAPPLTLCRSLFLIGWGAFITSIGQPGSIGNLPLRFLLKDRLHLKPQAMAAFFAVGAFAWYLKPLAGILSDSVPLFGTRRRHYLLLSAGAAGILWLLLGIVPKTFHNLLGTIVALGTMLVIGSTVIGGLLVEEGQKYHATGRLSSLRLSVMNLADLIAGPLGGFLAARSFGLTAGLGAALLLSLAAVAFLLLREPPNARRNTQVAANAWRELRALVRSGTLWSAVAMLFLVGISPGFATPLFYYQTNTLKFSSQFIGNLGVISGGLGILGAVVYGYLCQRLPLRPLLALGIVFAVVGTLFYLGYRSHTAAIVIEGTAGLVGTLAVLPLFDLAARATPAGSEGLGYALMMSIWNIANALSDVAGSWLFDHYHLTFMNLVWLNAGTTALVLLFVPFLPSALVKQHDESGPADEVME